MTMVERVASPTEKEARAALEVMRAFCQREIIVEECREVRAEGCYSCDAIRFFEIMDDMLPPPTRR